jgi:hypothetical protein
LAARHQGCAGYAKTGCQDCRSAGLARRAPATKIGFAEAIG